MREQSKVRRPPCVTYGVGRAGFATVLVVSVITASSLLAGAVQATARRAQLCFGQRATITATDGRDVIHGTSAGDVIVARRGDDMIYGGGGNDRICAGFGRDRIRGGKGADLVRASVGPDIAHGGKGNDLLRAGANGDVLDGGPGDDRMIGAPRRDGLRKDAVNFATAPRGVTIDLARGIARGWGRDVLVDIGRAAGSRFDDEIVGTRRFNRLWGGDGDDVMRGRAAGDKLLGGRGRDVIEGGRGRDRLKGFAGADDARGGRGADDIDGGVGADELDGVVDATRPTARTGSTPVARRSRLRARN